MKAIETTKEGLYTMIVVVGLTIALLVMAFMWKSSNQVSDKLATKKSTGEPLKELVTSIRNV
ncbi:MAG TPA: hypothetical protein DDW70_05135 [Rikenellaceae bacterium]|jgi:hypothetical protein|nr:hypothetical protein [Bacteroidales bacterium]HBG53576.1 hypothetical protein [Rikenellaceae bacterium]